MIARVVLVSALVVTQLSPLQAQHIPCPDVDCSDFMTALMHQCSYTFKTATGNTGCKCRDTILTVAPIDPGCGGAPPPTPTTTTTTTTTTTPTTTKPTTTTPTTTTTKPTTTTPTTTTPTTTTPTTTTTTKTTTTTTPTSTASWCTAEYLALDPDHTICKTDKGVNMPLSAADIASIIEQHHVWRRNVTGQAANMQKLYWDEDLARVASKHARQCYMLGPHDTSTQRAEPNLPGVPIGQNAAGGFFDVVKATDGWASEIKDFTYALAPTGTVGHYTQVTFAQTTRIGCGMANCTGVPGASWPKVQICNYAIGQFGDLQQPWVQGASCSACPGKCDASGKLCDCGGKVCYNWGTLNPATCTCACTRGWKGDLCELKDCPAQDTAACPNFISQNADPCKFGNVLYTECPYYCGWCP